MRSLYINNEDEVSDIRVSPIKAEDFTGLPAALVISAEYDPLKDEGLMYVERLRHAGVSVDYQCYAGTIHAFMSLAGAIEPGIQALDYAAGFLRRLS